MLKSREQEKYKVSTIKIASNASKEFYQSTENKETKNKGIQHTKAKLGETLKKMGKQSTSWPVY